jgi:hypothetical protein
MAPQAQRQVSTRSKRTAASRQTNGSATRRRRAAPRRRARSAEIGQLEQVIRNLEARIAHLTSGDNIRSTVSGATDQVSRQVGRAVTNVSSQMGDMAADMLTDVAGRLRGGATSVTSLAKTGTGALQKVSNELERRPFMTVALALGIGFLAGLAGSRNQAS